MNRNKANKIIKAISDLYKVSNITEKEFFKLSYEDKLLASLWVLIENTSILDTFNSINNDDLVDKLVNSEINDNLKKITNLLENCCNNNIMQYKDYSNELNILTQTLEDISKKIEFTNYTDQLNTLIDKLSNLNSTDVDLTEVITRLNTLIENTTPTRLNPDDIKVEGIELKDYTELLNRIITVLNELNTSTNNTELINSINALTTKLDTLNKTVTTLEDSIKLDDNEPLINVLETDVEGFNTATYTIAILNTATTTINVQGSLDNETWFNLPINYSSHTIKNNAVITNERTTVLIIHSISTKYIRLHINGLSVNDKIDTLLYLK